jgi:hypothetical protein
MGFECLGGATAKVGLGLRPDPVRVSCDSLPTPQPGRDGVPTYEETTAKEGAVVENRQVVDQRAARALGLIAARPRVFARQGVVVAGWRAYRGRRLGPYYRLAYREDGRQRSLYLGRNGPGVERVRHALAQLQGGCRWQRTYRRLRSRVNASLRKCKAELDRLLRSLGLWRKGFEVRGGFGRALDRHFASYSRFKSVTRSTWACASWWLLSKSPPARSLAATSTSGPKVYW